MSDSAEPQTDVLEPLLEEKPIESNENPLSKEVVEEDRPSDAGYVAEML
jgi:hypothetical protein